MFCGDDGSKEKKRSTDVPINQFIKAIVGPIERGRKKRLVRSEASGNFIQTAQRKHVTFVKCCSLSTKSNAAALMQLFPCFFSSALSHFTPKSA